MSKQEEPPLDRLFKDIYKKLEDKIENLKNMIGNLEAAFEAYWPNERIPTETLRALMWHIVNKESIIHDVLFTRDRFNYFDEMKHYGGPASERITQKIMDMLREAGVLE